MMDPEVRDILSDLVKVTERLLGEVHPGRNVNQEQATIRRIRNHLDRAVAAEEGSPPGDR